MLLFWYVSTVLGVNFKFPKNYTFILGFLFSVYTSYQLKVLSSTVKVFYFTVLNIAPFYWINFLKTAESFIDIHEKLGITNSWIWKEYNTCWICWGTQSACFVLISGISSRFVYKHFILRGNENMCFVSHSAGFKNSSNSWFILRFYVCAGGV